MALVQEQRGRFVHVIARLNIKESTGKIMYVNPANFATKADEVGDKDTLLVVLSQDGAELTKIHPTLRLPSCDEERGRYVALIQEDIPVINGMRLIKLIHNGKTCDTFDGGELAPVVKGAGMSQIPTLAAAAPFANRRKLILGGAFEELVKEIRGVSYTLQARPHGTKAWQTLAVGRLTPDLEVDVNQFPGATEADIRVLRTNGFSEEVISEGTVDIMQKE